MATVTGSTLVRDLTDLTSISTTGNITVGGTVDGRDVAADGATLDSATASNTPHAIVLRDGSGNFSANQITVNTGIGASAGIQGNVNGNVTGDVTGSAGSAATLTTARNIGGVSFNGSADIDLPGVNIGGDQDTTGSAATLTTARSIGGVSFNGSADINLPGVNTAGDQDTSGNADTATALASSQNFSISGDITASAVGFDGTGAVALSAAITDGSIVNTDINTNAAIADTKLATISTGGKVANSATTATHQNTNSAIVARDGSGDFFAREITATLNGSAATLTTSRSIGGVSFNGSADINLPGVNIGGNQNTTGNAATATSADTLTTTRNIGGVPFNGSADIDLPGVNTAGNQNTTGNAATATSATTLTTARSIGGVLFNGSANIDLPGVNTAGDQNTSGTATNATNVTINNDTSTDETHYVHFGSAISGNDGVRVSNSKLTFNPSSGVLSVNGVSVATTADLTASTSPNFSVDSSLFASGILTNGEGKAIYYDTTTSKWEGAYNDSSGEFVASHVIVDKAATDVKVASTGIFTLSGGLNANHYYFLSSTAGTATDNPDIEPKVFQPLYYALDANTIDLNIQAPQDTVITTYASGNNPGEEVHGGPIIYTGIPSDERLKENIESIQSDAISIVNELNPVSFDFKDPRSKYYEGQQLGFIAQEISEVIPQSVYTEDDEIQTMMLKPETVIPVLTKAIQELTVTVETLKRRVEELEGE